MNKLCAMTMGWVGFLAVAGFADDLHVAVQGNDAWSGRSAAAGAVPGEGPFATLERARDEIRKLKAQGIHQPVTVHVHGGRYHLHKTFELGTADSGTPEAPIVYRAAAGEQVHLIGGLQVANFQPIPAGEVSDRIDPAVADKLVRADLKALGIADFGQMRRRGFGLTVVPAGLELFFQDRPMTLARWPNEGFTKILDVTGIEPISSHGFKGDKAGVFTYADSRPGRWSAEPNIWLHGFWFWDWADTYEAVESIDAEKAIIRTKPPYHGYGFRKDARWYAVNLLVELDAPGEWYLDRVQSLLYFWPPAPLEGETAYVSILDQLIVLQDASYVALEGLTLEVCRGTAVTIRGGEGHRLAGCRIRNTGNGAVDVRGGKGHLVQSCDIYHIGETAISVDGGDRNTLTPAGHEVVNCHIHDYSRWVYTYRSAVSVAGVGNRVANNLIHDAPHNAIGLTGNDHLIERNEVHHVLKITDDAGAFYMGRDYTQRGNVVRHNYWHHLGDFKSWIGVQAVYLDDWSSDVTVFGNIFYKVSRGILVGGGRDNIIRNNLFAECLNPVYIDARGLDWAKYYFDGSNTTLTDRLNAVPYREPPWSERYPELLTLYDDEPAKPKGNVVMNNISLGPGWIDVHMDKKLGAELLTVTDNLVIQQADTGTGITDLFTAVNTPGRPAGFHFERIPVEQIGLQKDAYRSALPK